MTRRRVVIVGAGQRGRVWLDAVLAHPRWDLAGVVDVDLDVATRALTARGVTGVPVRSQLDGVVRSSDAVIVATPPDHHVSPCQVAIAAGRSVLVEKPFATSLEAAADLVTAAERAGVGLIVGQNYRFLRWVRAAKRTVDAGRIGRVTMVSMRYERPWDDVDAHVRMREDSVLWEIAPHHLDLVRHLFDDEVASVQATLGSFDPRRPRGATLHALLGTAGNARIDYVATYERGGIRRIEGGRRFSMRVVGDRGTLHVFQRWLAVSRDGGLPVPLRRGRRASTEEAALLDALADVAEGHPAPCTGRDNLATLALLAACVESARRGCAVDPRSLLDAAA